MKKIKAFEYRIGFGPLSDIIHQVNDCIEELNKEEATDITIDAVSTGKGVVYTITYEPKEKNNKESFITGE